MKLRLAALGMAATVALGANQANADGYVQAPRYAAPFSWTGFYIGGNVGGAWSDTQYLSNHVSGVGTCVGGGFVTPCDPVDHSATSITGGGQIGARLQSGVWVFGVEASLNALRLKDTTASFNVPATLNYSSELQSVYTATGQIGYARDRTLWYVKGGYAGGRMDLDSTTLPAPSAVGPAKTNLNGWTIGTGIEHALDRNFSIGLEYDYIRLEGDASTCTTGAASVFSCGAPGSLPLRYADITSDIHQVLLRLNYKFGRDEYRPLK